MPIDSPDSTNTLHYIYKKSAGICTVTRPTHRGLRIAQLSKTSNAEAHADMNTYSNCICTNAQTP